MLRAYLTFNLHKLDTGIRHLYPEQLGSLESMINVRGMEEDGDIEAFYLFFDELVPCVAGRKVWTVREKATKLISEAKKIVSVLDEAFTIIALTNYWDRWINGGTARWTDSRAGNYQYMGWADDAYTHFDAVCKRISVQRQSESNKKLEMMYLERAQSLQASGGPKKRKQGVEMQMEVYNELDSEGED